MPLPPIVYVPGLGAGPRSRKAALLAGWAASRGAPFRAVLPLPGAPEWRALRDATLAAVGELATPPVLVGASLGGLVAASLAARGLPVRALILLSPALHLAGLDRSYPVLDRAWDVSGVVPWWHRGERRWVGLPASLRDDARAEGSGAPAAVPTLLVHGRLDPLVPVGPVLRYRAAAPTAELWRPWAGHALIGWLSTNLGAVDGWVAGSV